LSLLGSNLSQQNEQNREPKRPVIPYWTLPSEESSACVARILRDHGFEKLNPILGGMGAWLDAGYPVEC
jgi:rhodanese-related sulfurtransferase